MKNRAYLKFISLLLTTIITLLTFSCSYEPTGFNINSVNSVDIKPSASGIPSAESIDHDLFNEKPSKIISIKNPPPKNLVNDVVVKHQDEVQFDTSFDDIPSKSISIEPGLITVIYKNQDKIKLEQNKKSVKSKNFDITNNINNILNKYKVIGSSDLGNDKLSDLELDEQQQKVSKTFKNEVPHRKSVHYYQFPADSDTDIIAKEFRALPYVRTAYPTPKFAGSFTPPYTYHTQTPFTDNYQRQYNISPPPDEKFGLPEENNWWWFNRHRIFYARDQYKNRFPDFSSNIVAVIDSGFDTGNRLTCNSPNYFDGVNITYINGYSQINYGNTVETNLQPEHSVPNVSHGAAMASLIASPENSPSSCSVSHIQGVIPGAKIYPIKLNTINSNTISTAIFHANDQATYTAISTISISLASIVPISYTADVRMAISYAVNGSNYLPVVISAGNSSANLDLFGGDCSPNPSCLDAGQITVGGSTKDSEYLPSNYGKTIDLVAAASNIGSSTFNYNYSNSYQYYVDSGTSQATAIVAATTSMMKNLAKSYTGTNYSALKIRDLLIYSSRLNYSSSYLGKNLWNSSVNVGLNAGYNTFMRELDSNRALTLTAYATYYNGADIVRIYNTDDYSVTSPNWDWNQTFGQVYYAQDQLMVWPTPLSSGQVISFYTSNDSGGGKGSFGYQYFKNGTLVYEKVLGSLTKYKSWYPYSGTYHIYDTIGTSNIGWFPESGQSFTAP